MNNIIYFILLLALSESFFLKKPIFRSNYIKGIKNFDPDLFDTYDLFEKFEYYSVLGDKEKQMEYLNLISLYVSKLNNTKKHL
jgi:hypothetical protein